MFQNQSWPVVLLLYSAGLSLCTYRSCRYSILSSNNQEHFMRYLWKSYSRSLLECIDECQTSTRSCSAVHFNVESSVCTLLDTLTINSTPWYSPVSGTIAIKNRDAKNMVVFRVSAGSDESFYNRWNDVNYESAKTVAVFDMEHKLQSIYKHPVVNRWNELTIQAVHFSLWENATEVVHLIFDGTNSDALNWFSWDRLMESTFPDLIENSPSFFSLTGYIVEGRRFYIAGPHGGCGLDSGWICLKDQEGQCGWEKDAAYKYPVFLYAMGNKRITWSDPEPIGHADDLVISLDIRL